MQSVLCTKKFLEACNLIFERGLLDKGGVNSTEHEILQNIDRGYNFFCTWLDTIITKGKPSIIPQGLILHDKYALCVLEGGVYDWRLA